uniref:Uncharacterized protein n=1 Tax=Arundo donax TaxID=35708 RepID=A0A0A9HL17_ARUDO
MYTPQKTVSQTVMQLKWKRAFIITQLTQFGPSQHYGHAGRIMLKLR